MQKGVQRQDEKEVHRPRDSSCEPSTKARLTFAPPRLSSQAESKLSESGSAQRGGLSWLDDASLAERGQILQRLLGDPVLTATAECEEALLNIASASSAPRLERLVARLLLRLVDATGCRGEDGRAGLSAGLLVTARALGLSVAEVVAGAVRQDVPVLSTDEQASFSQS